MADRRLQDLTTLATFGNMVITRAELDGAPRSLAAVSTHLSRFMDPSSPVPADFVGGLDWPALSIDSASAGPEIRIGNVRAYVLHFPSLPAELVMLYHYREAKTTRSTPG